jgi:transcription antitermination factor NusG
MHGPLERGDRISVLDGPYRGFQGTVEAVEQGSVKVSLPVFGRLTVLLFRIEEVRRADA